MSTVANAATPAPQGRGPHRQDFDCGVEIGSKPLLVRRAAVLGAGTMGSRIAAHLANAGIPVFLLDLPPKPGSAEPQLARKALDALSKSKPAAFFEPSRASLITPGNFDDDLPKLAQCDWIIEAVAEDLEIKTGLLTRVLPHLAAHALLTSNTSGLPIARIGAAIPNLRSRFFGTHFFNPPRYMHLLEVIPTSETDPVAIAAFSAFADRILGKQVVFAHDTPNFIANRIGIAVMFNAANLMLEQRLSIEEVDALTGPAIGWPRTGTFRLADLVGIDILAHVAANFPQGVAGGKFSSILDELLKRGWLGDKSGQGFYKKVRGPSGTDSAGKDERLVLDLSTFDYRPATKPALPSLEMAKNAATLPERLRLLLANDPAKDKAAGFLWPFLSSLWNFAADRIGEVADDAPSIDAAMRAGFNWELGPFEMWDAAGVIDTMSRMKAFHLPVSGRVLELIAATRSSWYSQDHKQCFEPVTRQTIAIPPSPDTPASPPSAAPRKSSAPTPALHLSISATASPASSCTRSKTSSAAMFSPSSPASSTRPPMRSAISQPLSSPATATTSLSAPTSCNSCSPRRKASGMSWPMSFTTSSR